MALNSNFNLFAVDSVNANADETIDFEAPVKKIKVSEEGFLLKADDDTAVELLPGITYEFPNRYGYPSELTFTNGGAAASPLSIFVEEFGDDIADEYYDIAE